MNINKPKLSKPKIGLTLAFMLAYTLLSGWAYFDFVYSAIFGWVGEEWAVTLLVVGIPSFIIQLASSVPLAVLMFKKPNSPVLAIPLLGYVLSALIYAVGSIVAICFSWGECEFTNALFGIIIYFITMLVFIAVFVHTIIATLNQGKKVFKFLSIIPTILSFLVGIACIVKWIIMMVFDGELIYIIPLILESIFIYIPFTLFVFFFCFSFADPYKKTSDTGENEFVVMTGENSYAEAFMPLPSQNVNSESEKVTKEKSDIEFLKQYKELLDMGAITQEEFEIKKKEILDNK